MSTYQLQKVFGEAEGLIPGILLVPAPLGLCAQERSLSSPYNLSPFVDRTSIKICITNGYICLALLKQIRVTSNPPSVSPYPSHIWFVGRAANRHTKRYGYNAD